MKGYGNCPSFQSPNYDVSPHLYPSKHVCIVFSPLSKTEQTQFPGSMALYACRYISASGERTSMSIHKTTILLVEDDSSLLHLLSAILTHSGYLVHSAQDGFSALAALRVQIPDILLSDLYMPGMSGFELLSVVRRRFPLIPVIAMSSAYSGTEVPTGIAADAFYEKATNLHALLGIVSGVHYLPDGRSPSSRSSDAPIWMAWNADGSEDKNIVLTCSECLRAFSELRAESTLVIHETKCLYCSTPIHYALVRSMSPLSSERLLPGSGTQVQTQPAHC